MSQISNRNQIDFAQSGTRGMRCGARLLELASLLQHPLARARRNLAEPRFPRLSAERERLSPGETEKLITSDCPARCPAPSELSQRLANLSHDDGIPRLGMRLRKRKAKESQLPADRRGCHQSLNEKINRGGSGVVEQAKERWPWQGESSPLITAVSLWEGYHRHVCESAAGQPRGSSA